ncbi:uncharacterized protein LOC120358608 isoform X2 [Solenopsis invicta]|uniref:uncharacterized protein LOC120358608 isoform X2 n=1 Tax=Solenopsis invicta TaxID=13686 RepID=UPI00193E5824|nr:uncharacterized protein LOC120358608 isoform X2 [Solenopsis invicta]
MSFTGRTSQSQSPKHIPKKPKLELGTSSSSKMPRKAPTRDDIDIALGQFFFGCNISFNIATFQKLCGSLTKTAFANAIPTSNEEDTFDQAPGQGPPKAVR